MYSIYYILYIYYMLYLLYTLHILYTCYMLYINHTETKLTQWLNRWLTDWFIHFNTPSLAPSLGTWNPSSSISTTFTHSSIATYSLPLAYLLTLSLIHSNIHSITPPIHTSSISFIHYLPHYLPGSLTNIKMLVYKASFQESPRTTSCPSGVWTCVPIVRHWQTNELR